jgi:hypothetical protein
MLRRLAIVDWLSHQSFVVSPNFPMAVRAWGPSEQTQYDGQQNPIQIYRSVLLHDASDAWFFLRDVVQLSSGESTPASISRVTPMSAHQWLCENGYAEEQPSVSG